MTCIQERVFNQNAIDYTFKDEKLTEKMNTALKSFKYITHHYSFRIAYIFYSIQYRMFIPTEENGSEVSCILIWTKQALTHDRIKFQ